MQSDVRAFWLNIVALYERACARVAHMWSAIDDVLPCADDQEDVALMRDGLRSYHTVSSNVWVINTASSK